MAQLTCPTCGRRFEEADSPAPPFCCERCRLIDLGAWLDERRGLPIEPSDDEPPPDWPEGA